MSNWPVYLAVAAGSLAVHVIPLKLLSDKISASLATVYIGILCTLTALSIWLFETYVKTPEVKENFIPNLHSLLIPTFSGIGMGFCLWATFMAFRHGGEASIVTPVMQCVTIALITIVGIYFFGENVSVVKIAGICAIVAGITMAVRG